MDFQELLTKIINKTPINLESEKKQYLKYIKYLAESSRRINRKFHFEKIFAPSKRSTKVNPLIYSFPSFNEFKNYINNDTNLRYYYEINTDKFPILGIGLLKILNKIDNSKNILYVGPIIYSRIKLNYENKQLKDFYIEELTLNYDIFSNLLNFSEEDLDNNLIILKKIEEEVENIEQNISHLNYLYYNYSYSNFEDFETQIDYFINNLCIFFKKINQNIDYIKEYIDYQKEIEIYYQNKTKIKSIDKGSLKEESIFKKEGVHLYQGFYFFWLDDAPFSAYSELKKIIQIEENNKEIISQLILPTIDEVDKDVDDVERKIQQILECDIKLDEFFEIFPFEISNEQIRAIKNSFSMGNFYIKGPPGTGKSHTISSYILMDLFLNQKVLVVAAKSPAISVIREKIEQILNFEGKYNFLPFIFYFKEYKQKLKQNLNNIIQNVSKYSKLYKNSSCLKNLKEELKNKIYQFKKELGEYRIKLRDYQNLLNEINLYAKLTENCLKIEENLSNQINKNIFNNLREINKFDPKLIAFSKQTILSYDKIINKNDRSIIINLYRRWFFKIIELFSNEKVNINLEKARYILKELCEYKENLLELEKIIKLNNFNDINKNEVLIWYKTEIEKSKEKLKIKLIEIIELVILNRIYSINIDILENFKRFLHYNVSNLKEKYSEIIKKFLDYFPIFICELRDLPDIVPLKENLFDRLVIDESSQVNLAEFLIAFYRAKKFIVVGDEKQLNIEAVGLGFSLSKKLDMFLWNKFKPFDIDYNKAEKYNIVVSKSSILDFLIENNILNDFNKITLKEHFRSLPGIIRFNNKKFYDNELFLMKNLPQYKDINSIIWIPVQGYRKVASKIIDTELQKLLDILKQLTTKNITDSMILQSINKLSSLGISYETIGIVSFISEGVAAIRTYLVNEFSEENSKNILVGTPEEIQGHEFDIVIIPLFLDKSVKVGTFYSNPRRFNVATSRAKYLNIIISNPLDNLPNFYLIREYLTEISYKENILYTNFSNFNNIDSTKFQSKLEEYVSNFLLDYIQAKNDKGEQLYIFNQYEFGPYKIDFVIFNNKNKKFVGIEVDGIHHFESYNEYSLYHKYRLEFLKRGGWNIINTPYYSWYIKTYLDKNHPILKKELNRIYSELDKLLF